MPPTMGSIELLRREGISDKRIFLTGNTVVDAVHQNRAVAADSSTVTADLDVPGRGSVY